MNRRVVSWILISLGGVLLFSAIGLGAQDRGIFSRKGTVPETPTGAKIGSIAPDFSLKNLEGATLTLSQYRGKAVLVHFWASWCDPCKEEMPLIQKAAQEHGDGLVVLGINDGESEDLIRPFVADAKLTFPVLIDPGVKVSDAYQVIGLPTSFFVDPHGTIQAIQIGSMTAGQLSNDLARIGVKP